MCYFYTMATITIIRSNEYINSMRNIGLYVDDEKVGVIGNGKTKCFEVAEGVHNLRAKIDWCGSPTLNFEVKEGEDKRFYLSGFKGSKKAFKRIVVVFLASFLLSLVIYNEYFDMLIIAYGLILLGFVFYILSIGRNKYLSLRVDS